MTKKIISIALVIVMMFSLSVTAFAAVDNDKVSSTALEAAELAFTNNGYEDAASSAKVSSVVDNGDNTYDVTVTSGLLYTYTCTVVYTTITADFGYCVATEGKVTVAEDVFTLILNQIYEFFLGIYEQIVAFFESFTA